MKLGMLLETEYPKDIRVRKEAESLVSGGISVIVITPWKKGQKRKEVINGVEVERIGHHNSNRHKGIVDTITALFFINWSFYFRLNRIIREHNIHHLHIHDLPLAKTGYLFRNKIQGKIILDSHENYPELLEAWFRVKKNIFIRIRNQLLFSPQRWKKYEARILPRMDRIIVVVEEMKEKFQRIYNLDPSKIQVVSNYEKKEFSQLSTTQTEDEDYEFDESVFYLIYVGGIGPMRGLDTAIEGIKILTEQDHRVKLIIIGSGNNEYVQSLKVRTSALNIEKNVDFLGYKPFEMVNYYMQKADLNIIPHERNGHTDFTIPHKLFQIFLSKSPILVSSCLPLKRIVENFDGGWVFEASNPQSFSDKVLEVKSQPAKAREKINNAYTAAMTELNWENEAEKLIQFYNSL